MRRLAKQQEEEGAEIDLTPMLDVVFIMLIFFIVTTTFVREAGIQINRPAAETAVKQEQTNILVAISPEGEIWIDGQRVDIRELRGMIRKLKSENPEAAVIIQADRDARAGLLVQAMDQARLAGVRDVAVAAEQP